MVFYYNGYSPNERSRRVRSLRKEHGTVRPISSAEVCEICGDPEGPFDYHSEDCSWPYRRTGYCLCRVCHRQKLHRRFASPDNWATFCAHVGRGGFGRETAVPAIKAELKEYQKAIKTGLPPGPLEPILGRSNRKRGWWAGLTCDRQILARFDTRLRADADILRALKPTLPLLSPIQIDIINAHYRSTDQTSTIPNLAKKVGVKDPSTIRAAYQNAGRLICDHSEYEPPKSENGSTEWLTIIAHRDLGQNGRAIKWVLNSSFGKAAKKFGII